MLTDNQSKDAEESGRKMATSLEPNIISHQVLSILLDQPHYRDCRDWADQWDERVIEGWAKAKLPTPTDLDSDQ